MTLLWRKHMFSFCPSPAETQRSRCSCEEPRQPCSSSHKAAITGRPLLGNWWCQRCIRSVVKSRNNILCRLTPLQQNLSFHKFPFTVFSRAAKLMCRVGQNVKNVITLKNLNISPNTFCFNTEHKNKLSVMLCNTCFNTAHVINRTYHVCSNFSLEL